MARGLTHVEHFCKNTKVMQHFPLLEMFYYCTVVVGHDIKLLRYRSGSGIGLEGWGVWIWRPGLGG